MKKTLIPLVTLALVMGAPLAFAETGSDSAPAKSALEQKREDLKQAQENFKKEVEQKKQDLEKEREAIKERADEARTRIRDNAATHTINMLNAMADRFQRLIDRTSSRLTKVKTAGGDVTVAQTNLDLAKSDLAKARTQITAVQAIDLTVSTGTSTTTQKATMDQFKAAVKAVKGTFTAVHKDLEKAVSSLNMSARAERNATTTASTTSDR